MLEATGIIEPLNFGGASGEAATGRTIIGVVEQFVDRDTLTMRSGSRRLRVRLVSVEAPGREFERQRQRPGAALQALWREAQPGSRVRLVILGDSTATEPALPTGASARGGPEALTAGAPVIHSTSEWGARPPKQPITVLAHRPTQIVVHHTTHPNTSNTTLAHAFEIAREIQAAHFQRGFIDTGQHFTVSRGGHIMEGRHQSLAVATRGQRHVLGSHARGCNETGVGIENEGLYTSVLPPPAQWRALVALCAWLCHQYGIAPAGIHGHRQCSPTECPGNALFARLPQLRQDVAASL